MAIKPHWHQRLSKSLHVSRSKPESRYFQLATIGTDGFPKVRTVVFRGFNTDGDVIKIITDSRSKKYQEMANEDKASICWYFAKSREQYRFIGHLAGYQQSATEREAVWNDLSENAKGQFLWGRPGTAINAESDSQFQLHTTGETNLVIPEHFCVLGFHIDSLDYLNLKQAAFNRPQSREVYNKEQGWVCQPLVP